MSGKCYGYLILIVAAYFMHVGHLSIQYFCSDDQHMKFFTLTQNKPAWEISF